MKNKNLPKRCLLALTLFVSTIGKSQAPVANFTVTPNTICTGSANIIQINDLSTNSPTGWSYTVASGGMGPGPGTSLILTAQNPTITFNGQGIYTITLISTNVSGASSAVTHTIRVLPSPNGNINPAAPTICPGASPITINVNTGGGPGGGGAVTYSWSTSATTSSITVSPSVTTVFSCILTSTNGCSSTRFATVTVAQPNVTLTSVPASICPGSSATITATANGTNTWMYAWSGGGGNSSITTSTAGVYSATLSDGNGCIGSASYTLGTSSTLSLTATSSQTAVCSGSTAVLNVSGANNYTWSTNSNLSSIIVNPTISTTYTVTGVLGTCTGTASVAISVSQIPTISIVPSANSACAGGTVSLTASGATTYTWLPGSLTGQNIVVTPGSNTTYTVRGTNPGCPVRTASVSISVAPSPVIAVSTSSTVICPGEAVALGASGANTYAWNTGAITAVILVTPTVSTSYTVTGTSSNNCSAKAVFTQSVNECTGINQLTSDSNQVSLYPNPTYGEFVLELTNQSQVQIYNAIGKLVYSAPATVTQAIDLSLQPTGVYFVVITSADNTKTLRVIKQ